MRVCDTVFLNFLFCSSLALQYILKSGRLIPPTSFFFQSCFSYSIPFASLYVFLNNLVYLYKNFAMILMGIMLDLPNGGKGPCHKMSLPVHEHDMSFHLFRSLIISTVFILFSRQVLYVHCHAPTYVF